MAIRKLTLTAKKSSLTVEPDTRLGPLSATELSAIAGLFCRERIRHRTGDKISMGGMLLIMLNYVFDTLLIALEMAEVVTPS